MEWNGWIVAFGSYREFQHDDDDDAPKSTAKLHFMNTLSSAEWYDMIQICVQVGIIIHIEML